MTKGRYPMANEDVGLLNAHTGFAATITFLGV